MLDENFIKTINKLYPDYRIYGPYPRKSDGRVQLVLSKGKAKITKLYAKFLMEVKLGRILSRDETIDHINENPLDDRIENLQILTRAENARKSSKGSTRLRGYKQKEEHKKKGIKNGQAKFNKETILEIRHSLDTGEVTVQYLIEKYKVSRKTIDNIKNRISYLDCI